MKIIKKIALLVLLTATSFRALAGYPTAPLKVALVSDAVAQAEQVRAAAAKDTIAIVYHSVSMTTAGLVDLLASISAAHGGTRIGHLGIVAHGGPGEVDLGKGEALSLATMPSQASALKGLRSVLTKHARLDLYSCSVAAGTGGKTFVEELAALTGAGVFASVNPVGTVPGADFVWECRTGQTAVSNELFLLREMEAIPRLSLKVLSVPYVQQCYDTANNFDGRAEPGRKALPRRGEFRLCSGGAGRCVSLCWFLAYRQ